MHKLIIISDFRHSGVVLVSIASVLCLLINIGACTHPVRRLVFQPHKIDAIPASPDNIAGLERFWLDTEQGPVEGWLLRSREASPQHPGPAVMIAHGNRELIDFYLNRARFYYDLGFTVLLGEYRGYGRSAGKASRERIGSDFMRFFDTLAALPIVDTDRILFHGRSLGGAVLAELSQHRRPAAVILESVFSSIKAMAYGAPDFLLTDNYDTGAALTRFDGPVLILHGLQDQVVPVRHARELKKRIAQASLVIGDFGHSDGPSSGFDYWGTLQWFIGTTGLLTDN